MKLRSNLVAMGVIGLKEEGVEMMSIQYSYLKTWELLKLNKNIKNIHGNTKNK